ncbi:hypothetical protein [uncultured Desulfovibrio sp.]|uniref:hypothetical protein n=1 Tax=uncultured Desulfovibrio sp. TaxID=167968 RepID=UPI0026118453|nr:hypothetical protein [uncultured Desulfovibrio sp.]
MLPLNYAILRYMTTVPEACAEDVVTALAPRYGRFKALRPLHVRNALLTAVVNGLLEESRCELGPDGELRLYFRAHDEGAATIRKYIRDDDLFA